MVAIRFPGFFDVEKQWQGTLNHLRRSPKQIGLCARVDLTLPTLILLAGPTTLAKGSALCSVLNQHVCLCQQLSVQKECIRISGGADKKPLNETLITTMIHANEKDSSYGPTGHRSSKDMEHGGCAWPAERGFCAFGGPRTATSSFWIKRSRSTVGRPLHRRSLSPPLYRGVFSNSRTMGSQGSEHGFRWQSAWRGF